jgi:SAM-dependent methyltransferase
MSTGHPHPDRPSAWVERFAALVPASGSVLDVACGGGRHVRLFAGRGHPVVAVDRNLSALPPLPGVERLDVDLEDGSPWPLPGRRFAAVVVTNYLWRPLFPVLIDSLAPGGVLIYETYALGNERYGRPRNPEHLLRPGELLEVVRDRLAVVAYESGLSPRSAVVQRLCAVNSGEPQTLP